MTTLELIDQKEQLRIKAENIINSAEKECRKLNEEETNTFAEIKQQIADVEKDIRDLEKELNNKTVKRTMEKFSLLKAINDVANNRNLDEKSQEIVNAGIAEMRKAGQSYSGQIVLPVEERSTVQATVTSAGEEVVAEDKLNILEPLRANLVLTGAGASYMTGLVGNVSIPTYSGSSVGWAGEIADAADGAGTFGEVNLEPKRLTAYLDISKQFLIQDSVSAEEMLRNDIVRAIANKLEETILGDAAGTTTKPAGLFYNVTADASDVTFADMVEMEADLEDANVYGELTYIVSPSAKAILRTTAKDAGSGLFVMDNNEINGIKVLSTSACTDKGVILGNFNDYVIGQWGGIDLTVDPYTQAAAGKVRLVVNAFFDAKPRRAEAFVEKILH